MGVSPSVNQLGLCSLTVERGFRLQAEGGILVTPARMPKRHSEQVLSGASLTLVGFGLAVAE